ncbi:MAG: hypothetical protein JNM14_01305 [Ferruginibacter sp.]|nr:hypothetical protein [Ferruginibacter sp.]
MEELLTAEVNKQKEDLLLYLQLHYPVVHDEYINYVVHNSQTGLPQPKVGYEIIGRKVILEVEQISKDFFKRGSI